MAKRAVLHVSMDLLHELLELPEDVEVLHVAIGNYGLTLDLIITAPNMAETDPLAHPPSASANYVIEDGRPRLASLAYPSDGSLTAAAKVLAGAGYASDDALGGAQ